jgi:signal transduction histidine kinase
VSEYQLEQRELQESYKLMTQQLIGLRMVQRVSQALVSEMDLDQLLKRILRSAIDAVHGEAGALILLDQAGQDLIFSVVEGGGGEALQGQRMSRDRGLAGWVVSRNEPLIIANVQKDGRFYESIPKGVDFEVASLICAPLLVKGEPIGVVQVLNKAEGERFDEDDLNLLTSFAAQSAIAIENTRLYQDLRRERDRLIAVEDQIRKRLARDLHDGPTQLLAVLISNINFIGSLQVLEPEKVPDELASLLPVAEKALRQLRTLLFDLRPVILETQGLVPALQQYVERQQGMGDLNYALQVDRFAGRLTSQAERAVFGIVQEAVGNVRKHARARNIWISVDEQVGDLFVMVHDDGVGFDIKQLNAGYDQRGSLGMLNMRERAESIGGSLILQSEPGAGATVGLVASLAQLRLPAS